MSSILDCLHKPSKELAHNGSIYLDRNQINPCLSDIADPIIFAKKGPATFVVHPILMVDDHRPLTDIVKSGENKCTQMT